MRFATLSAAVVALLSATPVFAQLPGSCVHDQFYPDGGTGNPGCKWYVCVNGNSYRQVRDCGAGGRCKTGQPTSCVDRLGNTY